MPSPEAHRFKHKIVVSEYLISDLENAEDDRIFTVTLGQKMSGEKLFAKIHHELSKLSNSMLDGDNEHTAISFFAYTGEHENHAIYEQRATIMMDAIQSFFIEYHQSKVGIAYLVADNHIFRGVLMNHSTKH